MRRYAPFLGVLALSAVLLMPLCDVLHHCGCRMPWAGGESHCNIHAGAGGAAHCPWCEHRWLGAIAAVGIVGGQLVVYRLARRRLGGLGAAGAALVALAPLSVAGGALVWLPTDYPHFLVGDARARAGLPDGPIRCKGNPPHAH